LCRTEKIFKAPFRGDKYGHTIEDAIKSLEAAVNDFKTEAKICDAQRLGQVDRVTMRTLMTTARLDDTTQKTASEVRRLNQGTNIPRKHDRVEFV
jgi:hypothetical protein